MRRIYALSLVASVFSALLTACGGSDSPAPPATYSVGGSISGYTGSGLVLQDNGANNDAIASGTATFSFAGVASGAAYSVTVATQPSGETCAVTGGTGTATGNVTAIVVACTANSYSVGGTISGYAGSGLVLQNNGAGNDTIAAGAKTFSFADVTAGTAYKITVATQPSGETCTVTGGTGTVTANVTSVAVACVAAVAPVSSTVTATVGASPTVLTIPLAGNFSGTLNVPATVGGVSTSLTVQLSTQLAALAGNAAKSNLPVGTFYVIVSAASAVQFKSPMALTLTAANGDSYALVPYVITGTTATVLGPQIRGAATSGSTPASVTHAADARQGVSLAATAPLSASPGNLSYFLASGLLSTIYGPNTLGLVGNLGAIIGASPPPSGYSKLPTLAPGVSVVMPQDGSNAIRVFAANANGAVAPALVPAVTTVYPSGASPSLYQVQIDEAGTVYALDPYNLTLFSWTWGSTAAPSILVSELPAPGSTSLITVVSFAVNPQGTLVAFLVRALDTYTYVVVYDIAAQTWPQYFEVANSEFPTQVVNLAMDAFGQIYYTDGINAYVYAAGANGAAQPIQKLSTLTLNFNATDSEIGQLLVQTTAATGGGVGTGTTSGGIVGTVYAVSQSTAANGSGDVFLDSFYPASTDSTPGVQDLSASTSNSPPGSAPLGLICATCAADWLGAGSAGYGASFSVGAADAAGNLYLYTIAQSPDLSLKVPAVEVFGSSNSATPGNSVPRSFSDSVSAFPGTALASLAVVPEPVVTVSPATLTVAAGASASVTVSERGYTGTFTPGTCSVATLTAGTAGTFAIAGSTAGTCTVAFSDNAGRLGKLSITVTGSTTTALSSPQGLAFSPVNGNLYVASGTQVLIYSENTGSPFGLTQVGTITAGISSPTRLTFDGGGNLYVANDGTNTVTVYAGGAAGSSPVTTISEDVSRPLGVAVDGLYNLFVGDNSNGTLSVYSDNQTGTPSSGFSELSYSPLLQDAAGNSFAQVGALYYANLGSFGSYVAVAVNHPSEILVYTDLGFGAGSAPIATLATGVNGPTGIALFGNSEMNATLYIANLSSNNVEIYNVANALEDISTAPTGTITSGVSGPEGVAVDAAGRIFVSNSVSNTITVYAASGTGAPIYTQN